MATSNPRFSGYGLGLRKEHYSDFLETSVAVDFVEVISENFMVAGGQPLHILRQIRERHPVALHGVARLVPAWKRSLRGAVLTLKMNDEAMRRGLPGFVERVRGLGFAEVHAAHLPSNRTEVCVVALR